MREAEPREQALAPPGLEGLLQEDPPLEECRLQADLSLERPELAGRPLEGRQLEGRQQLAGRLQVDPQPECRRLVDLWLEVLLPEDPPQEGRLLVGRLLVGRLLVGRLLAGRLVAGPLQAEGLLEGERLTLAVRNWLYCGSARSRSAVRDYQSIKR